MRTVNDEPTDEVPLPHAAGTLLCRDRQVGRE
jgi:hypothetical protein